jgi:hypothetical protein
VEDSGEKDQEYGKEDDERNERSGETERKEK